MLYKLSLSFADLIASMNESNHGIFDTLSQNTLIYTLNSLEKLSVWRN